MHWDHRSKRHRTAGLAIFVAMVSGSSAYAQVNVILEFNDPGNRYLSYHNDIRRVFLAAAREWTDHIEGTADLEIEILFQSEGQALMFSAASIGVLYGSHEGSDVYQWGTVVEILEGEDPNGADPDGLIGINPDYLDRLWFDPAPGTGNPNVPPDKYDAYSVVLHEYGHIFAFNGWLVFGHASGMPLPGADDQPTPILRPREILKCGNPTCRPQAVIPDAGQSWVSMNGFFSPFDTHIVGDAGGRPYFIGPNVTTFYSEGIPFDADSYTHINVPGSVMYTYAFPGVRDQVTSMELAILADCDVPVKNINACRTGTDSDGDGVDDCFDACPLDPDRTTFGPCGCEPCPGEEDLDPNDNQGNAGSGDEVVLGDQPEVPLGGAACGAGAVTAEAMLLAIGTLTLLRRRR